jgi:hypothetical protein
MNLRELTTIYFNGNEAAVSFIEDLFAAWHIWDDLIDKDKEITDESINQAFFTAFINIPRNPFYQANFNTLSPLLENAFINWFAANKLEQNKENLEAAYALRNINLSIIVACANIIGGVDWAASVAIDIQTNLKKNDPFEVYVEEFNKD